jgi:hypothetical protein
LGSEKVAKTSVLAKSGKTRGTVISHSNLFGTFSGFPESAKTSVFADLVESFVWKVHKTGFREISKPQKPPKTVILDDFGGFGKTPFLAQNRGFGRISGFRGFGRISGFGRFPRFRCFPGIEPFSAASPVFPSFCGFADFCGFAEFGFFEFRARCDSFLACIAT